MSFLYTILSSWEIRFSAAVENIHVNSLVFFNQLQQKMVHDGICQ